jgi:hypothetical protein
MEDSAMEKRENDLASPFAGSFTAMRPGNRKSPATALGFPSRILALFRNYYKPSAPGFGRDSLVLHLFAHHVRIKAGKTGSFCFDIVCRIILGLVKRRP